MTTSAFGSRPKVSCIAALARTSAACEYAIESSRLLNRYFLSVRACCSSFGTSLMPNDRSPMAFISASRRSTCCSPVEWTSFAGTGSELWYRTDAS